MVSRTGFRFPPSVTPKGQSTGGRSRPATFPKYGRGQTRVRRRRRGSLPAGPRFSPDFEASFLSSRVQQPVVNRENFPTVDGKKVFTQVIGHCEICFPRVLPTLFVSLFVSFKPLFE